ncbi:MAG TPA: type II toxin-antitoxin system VapB family antitoxin [Terriglobales bacterium]|nr:type II toxin-antitoxin system VapB family antitoxin [Terriglobales bacterium]
MQRKATIFMNNRSQAVRLPKDFQFKTQEVFIRKEGSDVVLSPRPTDWLSYLADAPRLGELHGRRRRPAGTGAQAVMLRYMLDTDTWSYII